MEKAINFHKQKAHIIALKKGQGLPLSLFSSNSHCKVAPESWGIGGSKVVSSKGLEGYEMFDPRDSRREDREEENT